MSDQDKSWYAARLCLLMGALGLIILFVGSWVH